MRDLIGFMDSGVGGISVLKRAVELLPHENFLFYGDNANAPYGTKRLEEIVALSERSVNYLLEHEVKAIVIACNTATSAYAEILRKKISIPVIGMEPAIKPASLARTNGSVLAMATRATLSLSKFERLMERYGEGVIPIEGKGLVEIVESGMADSPQATAVLESILGSYRDAHVDGIVLGCTHYPFLKAQIAAMFPGVPIFDGRTGTVRQLERRLRETGCLSANTGSGTVTFASSAGHDKTELMQKLFYSEELDR